MNWGLILIKAKKGLPRPPKFLETLHLWFFFFSWLLFELTISNFVNSSAFIFFFLTWKFLLRYSLLEVSFEAIWWFTRQNIDSSCCYILPFGSNEWWNWIISIFGTICKLDISHWFKMTCRRKLTLFFDFDYRWSLWYWQQMQLWVWLLKRMLKKLLRFLLLNKALMFF